MEQEGAQRPMYLFGWGSPHLLRAAVAEFLATMLFLFFGESNTVQDDIESSKLFVVVMAFLFSLVVEPRDNVKLQFEHRAIGYFFHERLSSAAGSRQVQHSFHLVWG